jgi:hypothetical protein
MQAILSQLHRAARGGRIYVFTWCQSILLQTPAVGTVAIRVIRKCNLIKIPLFCALVDVLVTTTPCTDQLNSPAVFQLCQKLMEIICDVHEQH